MKDKAGRESIAVALKFTSLRYSGSFFINKIQLAIYAKFGLVVT